MVERAKRPAGRLEIALVGKYVALHDAYISVVEALTHGGIENGVQVDVRWVDSEDINDSNAAELLAGCAGIIVPGGFGNRGIEGMISAVCWARENQVPYLGIARAPAPRGHSSIRARQSSSLVTSRLNMLA